MANTISRSIVLFPALTAALFADFSYDQNSRVTGGALAGALKVAAVFSKQAREPMRSSVALKGNRMAHISQSHASIIDLDKETITNIDLQKKTWSVMTFAEMQQAIEQAAEKMKQKQADKPKAEMNFKVSVDSTGQTKDINGMATRERLMRLEMEMSDDKGQKGTMLVTTDAWVAPKVPGYDELLQFYQKMAAKLAWTPNQMGMAARPDLAKGMAAMAKEAGKLEGTPVYETIRMGGEGLQAQAPAPGEQPKQQQSQQPSVGSALGGALGGRFGLGRKKQQPQQDSTAASQPPAQNQNAGMLLEMVTETSNFSTAPVDPSKFDVPAGFKQVQADSHAR